MSTLSISKVIKKKNHMMKSVSEIGDGLPMHETNVEQEALMDSHMKIVDQSALLSISDLKGNIIYANQLFCKVSKYNLEEVINKPHSIIRHEDTPAYTFQDMWTTIGQGKVWQGEIKNKAKDGSSYWVIATIAPIMGINGKPIKYISVRYDITKQKEAEEELKLAKKKVDTELLENIAYAKHIHSSFLSNDVETDSSSDSFLIYRAQKIISGDFYKIEKSENKLMLVMGDSTGHGISASYISVLALNILSRLMIFSSENPGKILKLINIELNRITHLNREKPLMESADMIVCCVDKDLMKLTYASARMRAFIFRDGEAILLEKDKCTIGAVSGSEFEITNRNVDLKKGDCLYIASDGLFDQIGGTKDKCIRFKNVLAFIKSIQDYTMPEQKLKIIDMIDKWKGLNEQTDDVTLFAIKI